jgi:hypothetical protein
MKLLTSAVLVPSILVDALPQIRPHDVQNLSVGMSLDKLTLDTHTAVQSCTTQVSVSQTFKNKEGNTAVPLLRRSFAGL